MSIAYTQISTMHFVICALPQAQILQYQIALLDLMKDTISESVRSRLLQSFERVQFVLQVLASLQDIVTISRCEPIATLSLLVYSLILCLAFLISLLS